MRTRLIVLLCALVLSACRVDATIDVAVNDNGSGVVTITATADVELVAKAPGLADDLRFDDVRAAGWTVDGPATNVDGTLSVVLRHAFASPEQATSLLASLNGPDGPLSAVAVERTATKHRIDIGLSGSARMKSGLGSFADADLLATVGAVPYAEQIAAAGLTPEQALGLTFSASLPGTIASTSGAAAGDGRVLWQVPLDGATVDLTSRSTVSLDRGGWWPKIASGALVALIAWLALSVGAIAFVAVARRRRSLR